MHFRSLPAARWPEHSRGTSERGAPIDLRSLGSDGPGSPDTEESLQHEREKRRTRTSSIIAPQQKMMSEVDKSKARSSRAGGRGEGQDEQTTVTFH